MTVLTSSRGNQKSREDAGWGHGAFTEALLDALNDPTSDTENRAGLINATGLANYVAGHVASLNEESRRPIWSPFRQHRVRRGAVMRRPRSCGAVRLHPEDPIGASFRYRQDAPGALYGAAGSFFKVPFSSLEALNKNGPTLYRDFEIDPDRSRPPQREGWGPYRPLRAAAKRNRTAATKRSTSRAQSQAVAGRRMAAGVGRQAASG